MNKRKIKDFIYNIKFNKLLFVIILAILMILGGTYIVFSQKNAENSKKKEVLQFAGLAATVSDYEIDKIFNNRDVLDYTQLELSLSKLVNNNGILSAYIYVIRQGEVYIIADSQPQNGEDDMPKLYKGDDHLIIKAYTDGKPYIQDDKDDIISVFMPINAESGDVYAIIGIDYPADNFNSYAKKNIFMSASLVCLLLLTYAGIYFILNRNKKLYSEKIKLEKISKQLSESEFYLQSVFEQAGVGIAVVDKYRFVLYNDKNWPSINPMFEKIMGRSKEELAKISWKDITHPDDLDKNIVLFEKFRNRELNGYEIDKRFIKPDGSIVWVRVTVSALNLDGDQHCYHLCLIKDITESKMLEQSLKDSERSKALLLESLPGMSYQCKYDKDWTMLYVSVGCQALTGYAPESLLYNKELSFNDIIAEKDRKILWGEWKKAVKNNKKMSAEYEIVTADGKKKWVWEQGQVVYGKDGKPSFLEGIILDITTRKLNELRLKHINEHDPITGLPNINLLIEFIKNDMQNKINDAVMMLDIRRFDVLKATFGHKYCEKIAKVIAASLLSFENEKIRIFHISINQFVIYIKEYGQTIYLEDLCKSIIKNLHKKILNKAINYNIGVMLLQEIENLDIDLLLRNLGVAANNVSEKGEAGYCFYNNKIKERQSRQALLRKAFTNIAEGKDEGELYLVYQPILDLKTEKPTSLEALARYNHPQLGNISPIEFIPILERSQLILPIGRIIMRKAIDFAKTLERNNLDISVAINISAIQLLYEGFIDDITSILKETEVKPNRIIIEITESIFIEGYKEVKNRLDIIKGMGIRIAIDDFGTGYSSLSREKEIKADYLKMDKSFIDGLKSEDHGKCITSDIISMAHKLGSYVVAEGIEHEAQKEYLKKHKCDMMQGYWYSKPLPEQNTIEFLLNNK